MEVGDRYDDVIVSCFQFVFWNFFNTIHFSASRIETFQLNIIFLYIEYLVGNNFNQSKPNTLQWSLNSDHRYSWADNRRGHDNVHEHKKQQQGLKEIWYSHFGNSKSLSFTQTFMSQVCTSEVAATSTVKHIWTVVQATTVGSLVANWSSSETSTLPPAYYDHVSDDDFMCAHHQTLRVG